MHTRLGNLIRWLFISSLFELRRRSISKEQFWVSFLTQTGCLITPTMTPSVLHGPDTESMDHHTMDKRNTGESTGCCNS
jgi:hypothetical protein